MTGMPEMPNLAQAEAHLVLLTIETFRQLLSVVPLLGCWPGITPAPLLRGRHRTAMACERLHVPHGQDTHGPDGDPVNVRACVGTAPVSRE